MAKSNGKRKKVDKLSIALKHLDRVRNSWDIPTDWDDLSLYGFYCLEAAVEAVAIHCGLKTSMVHAEKASLAKTLHKQERLPDVSDLLIDLNAARKAAAYGDIEAPELDAADVAEEIETYVSAVQAFVAKQK